MEPGTPDTRHYIEKALFILRSALCELIAQHPGFSDTPVSDKTKGDVSRLLRWVLKERYSTTHKTLGNNGCKLLKRAEITRNLWAHQHDISLEEAIQSMKDIGKLLSIMQSRSADELEGLVYELTEEHDKLIAFEEAKAEWWQRWNEAGKGGHRITEPPPSAYVPLFVPTDKRCALCNGRVDAVPMSVNPWTGKSVNTGLPDICSVCKLTQPEGLVEELNEPPETWDLIVIMVISGASGGPPPIPDLTGFLEEKGVENPSETLKIWRSALLDLADGVSANEAKLGIHDKSPFSTEINSAVRYLSLFIQDD